MRTMVLALTAALLVLDATWAFAKPPRAELAGLTLGMSEEAAHASLAKHGKPLHESGHERESEEHESWALAHGPWAYVSFGVAEDRVSWVTAFARRGGHRIRYRELGSLNEAHRSGTYFFIWNVPAIRGARPYKFIARGTDSLYVASASLTRDAREAVRGGAAPSDPDRRAPPDRDRPAPPDRDRPATPDTTH